MHMRRRRTAAALGAAMAMVLGLLGPAAVANGGDPGADFEIVVPRAPQH